MPSPCIFDDASANFFKGDALLFSAPWVDVDPGVNGWDEFLGDPIFNLVIDEEQLRSLGRTPIWFARPLDTGVVQNYRGEFWYVNPVAEPTPALFLTIPGGRQYESLARDVQMQGTFTSSDTGATTYDWSGTGKECLRPQFDPPG